jgi:molecular chaperone HscB
MRMSRIGLSPGDARGERMAIMQSETKQNETKQSETRARDGKATPAGGGTAPSDHFAVLGLERAWHLDRARLAERHLALTRELHPDRFAQASPRERLLSLERTTALNDAFRTLNDPIRRAEYILRQAGIGHGDHDLARGHETAGTAPEFLEEIMHVRERMLELDVAGGRGREQPEALAIRAAAAAKIRDLDRGMDERFTAWERDPDGPGSRALLLEIDRGLGRRRYYVNIVREIDGEEIPAGHGAL